MDGATAAYLNRFGTESIDSSIVMGIKKLISAMQARGVVEVLDWGTSNLYGGNIDLCLAPIAMKVFLYGGKEGIPALRRYFSLPAKRVQGDYNLINSIPNERLLDLLQIVSELEDQPRTETLRVNLVARLYRIDPVRAEEEIASRQYPEWVWKKIARDQAPDIEAAIIILRKHYPEEDSSPSDLLTGDERFSFPPFDVARQIDHLSRENQEHLVIETVRDMSRVNLRRTIDWAEALEDPALRAYAFRGITKIWARTDPRAASRWLEGIPPGAHRNPAIKIIVHSELPHAQRLEWAQLISDETDRSEGLESLITETHSSIPIERFHSLQALDLPEEQKKKLNRTLFTGEK